ALVVDRLAAQLAWQQDWAVGMLERTAILHEHHRVLGQRVVPFGRMTAIVQSDANDISRNNRREHFSHFGGYSRIIDLVEQIARQSSNTAVVMRLPVMDTAGGILIANDLHRYFSK